MKIGKKITLAIALTLGSIIIGTNVSAIDFNQRILSDNNLLLGASVDSSFNNGSSTTTTKEFNQTSWWETWKKGESVEITWEELKKTPELLCIESEAGLPSGIKIKYSKKEGPITFGTGESSYEKKEDYKIAYILSEPINSEQSGKELYEQDIQGALWRTEFNIDKKDLDEDNLAGQELYIKAEKYADYKNEYKEPQSIDAGEVKTVNSEENKIVGPLKIKYKMTYVTLGENTTMFGNITSAILKDGDGKEYKHGTEWWFVDANGAEITNKIGEKAYNYPTSEQIFYIKIKAGLNITKANLSFKFNNINAKAEAMTLEGSYDYPAYSGGALRLCPYCSAVVQTKLNKVTAFNCYSIINGNTYKGYAATETTSYKLCRSYYELITDMPEELGNSPIKFASCGGNSVSVDYVFHGNEAVKSKTVICGEPYSISRYDSSGRILLTTTTETAKCQKYIGVTTYTLSECTKDGKEGSCKNHIAAYEEGIEFIKNGDKRNCAGTYTKATKVNKDGSLSINGQLCGITNGYPAGTARTQTLTIAKGERTTTEDTFTLSFDIASVDLSLRKFITAVNEETITNRVPQVDVGPLQKGQTTSNYNHTKETIGVKVGDLVTYTIRVYNEGAVDAYASEIKDYLPSNLEFVSGKVDGVDYKWTKSTDGRTITTTYLKDTKLTKFDGTSLKYADVKVICKVKNTANYNERLVNLAEITKYAYSSNNQIVEISKDVDSTRENMNKPSDSDWSKYNGNGSVGNYVKGQEDDDDFESVTVTKWVDISLRKFITAVNDEKITNRIPQVDVSPLKNGKTTSNYNHTKETVGVKVGDKVTYTIRVYNEGLAAGYATEIKDHLPANLEFVSGKVDGVDYGWTVSKDGRTITTTYLKGTKLEAFNGKELKYADVKVTCRVKETAGINERLVNIAEISNYALDVNGKAVDINKDIDSTENNLNKPNDKDWSNYNGNGSIGNYVKGQEDDDDFESVTITKTDIGGTVWLDGVEGKQEERDGILTSKDKRLSGIKVRLYTSENNYTKQIAETTTDSNGKYSFDDISFDGIYMVAFEYGGQQYIPVTATRLNSGKYTAEKSAGEERKEERTALNAKFYEITKDTAKNSSGNSTVSLNYKVDSNKHTSSLVRDNTFYNASKIVARTEGGFSGGATYAKNINLGLIERAQVNLGLMTDVSKVELDINGNKATYDYNGRDEGTAINIEAKAADLNRVYNQAIYKSDYNYRIADYNQEGETVKPDVSNELQVYITYKIKVKNYSSKAGKVSQLVTYFAPEYNVVESWYEKGSSKANVSWVSAGNVHGYKKVTTDSIKGVNIGANEDVYVYVKVQVAKDAQGGVALGEKYIIAEIGAYTTDEGLIDTNSEPGNIDVSNWDNYVKTYEDDTDRAPGLNLYIKEGASRTMTGYVWEDLASGTDADGVKIGDGIKNGREQNKNGITVQLIELVTIGDKTYEYIWQEVQTGSNKVSYMDRNGKLHENSKEVSVGTGEYKFTDFVPGKYIVRFKYGDTESSISLNGQDYKSTTYKGFGANTSSAKDNKDRRLAVMNYSIKQTNDKAEVLAGNNKTELIKNTWMYADTVEKIEVGVNTENLGYNVNFGLLKRPISKLVAIKEVNGIKISNKGIVYVDTANGINTGLRQAYGSYFIELDDELINGAQLEVSYKIRVENQGEKDTLYNYFEGEAKYGSNQHEIIKTQAELVYDYPEKLGYDEDNTINPSWTKEGVDISILKEEVQGKINNGALVVKATEKLNKALKPGESTETIYMTLSKIMAAGGDDELNYSNKVEIVSRRNEVGRRDEESTPGNYEPNSEEPKLEPDTGIADVTITDPTGQDRIYYGLGIGIGILLIAGISLIKILALGKKK